MLINNNFSVRHSNPNFNARLKIKNDYDSKELWNYTMDDINYYNASNNKDDLYLTCGTFRNYGEKMYELKRFYTEHPDDVVEFSADRGNGFQFKNLRTGQIVSGVYMGLINHSSNDVLNTLGSLNYNQAFWEDNSLSYLSDLVVNDNESPSEDRPAFNDPYERRCEDHLENTPEGWKIVPATPTDHLVYTPEGWKIKS